MRDLLFLAMGALSIILAGLNLRSVGNSLVFSVSVLGRHASMRRLGINALVYWLGTISIVGPVVVAFWQFSSYLGGLDGADIRLSSYGLSSLFMAWGLFNLYVYKVGPRRDAEGRLRNKMVTLSRSVGTIKKDFLFGLFNGVSVVLSEAGIIIGGIWLIQAGGGFGFVELSLTLLAATSTIWAIFMVVLYGFNLGYIERFRKAHGAKVSFACGVMGVLGSWLILASSIGLI